MEGSKKSGNVLTIVLVVLLFIAVGVICYLLGSNSVKDSSNNNNSNPTEEKENNDTNENNTVEEENTITPVSYTPKCSDSQTQQKNLLVDIDETKYNNIVDYIQGQKNISMTISSCESDKSNTNDELGMTWVDYKLTKSEINVIFNAIKNSSYNISNSGIGGICVPSLDITYERNDKIYNVSYYGYLHLSSDDGNIYKILDKNVSNTLTEPQYCLYSFSDFSSTITSVLESKK